MRRDGVFAMQMLLLLIGGILLGVGVGRGEAGVVMMKAVRICLECIGIG